MEQTTRKMTLSQIRDLLQTIHEVCTRFQLVSLNRRLAAGPTAKPFAWRKREVKGSQLRNTIVNLRN